MFKIKGIQRPKREEATSLAEPGPEAQPCARSSQRVMYQKNPKRTRVGCSTLRFPRLVPKSPPPRAGMWACRVGRAGLQVAVWCPSRRHPHLHRPLSLAPGHGPAAGWFPRLHPRGAHQQRAPGLQGPPPTGPGRLAGLQVLQRVQARPVPSRGEGQRGV